MGNTTTYKVETVYEVVDRSTRSLGEIEKATKAAARSAESLSGVLKGLAAVVTGSFAFRMGKSALIDYNAEIENSKTVIAGMLSMYTGASIDKSWDRAAVSVERFQRMAAKSSLTTKDLVSTAQGLTRPLIQAGIAVTDIEKLTFGTANAAKAMGMHASTVAFDIEQAIRGTVGMRDRFMTSMLAQKGIDLNYEQFNKLSQEKRVDVLKRALDSPAIKAMAEKQSTTWTGVMSTLEDNFQIAMGKVGLPLFKAVTEEVKGWNKWLENNTRKIDEFGKSVASGLVTGLGYVKDVFKFIYDHADTLITIAKAWAAVKIGSMITGGLGGSADGIIGKILGAREWMRGGRKSSDSFDPFTGEYAYSPSVEGGRGRQKVGGFRGAMDNAGLLGGALGAGLAIGTFVNNLTGLSHSISGTKEVNGKLYDTTDKTTNSFVMLLRSMNALDEAVNKVADDMSGKGTARGTAAYAGIQGLANTRFAQADLLRDTVRDFGGRSSIMSAIGLQKLRESGLFDEDEMSKIMRGPQAFSDSLFKEADQLKSRARAVSSTAETAWEDLPTEIQKTLDKDQFLNKAYQEGLKQMKDKSMYAQHVVLDEKSLNAIVKSLTGVDPMDKDFQANPPKQTVNITIQRVMAKDPNKWIAEMDDIVARRTRAPTTPRSGWKPNVR